MHRSVLEQDWSKTNIHQKIFFLFCTIPIKHSWQSCRDYFFNTNGRKRKQVIERICLLTYATTTKSDSWQRSIDLLFNRIGPKLKYVIKLFFFFTNVHYCNKSTYLATLLRSVVAQD